MSRTAKFLIPERSQRANSYWKSKSAMNVVVVFGVGEVVEESSALLPSVVPFMADLDFQYEFAR